MNFSARDSGDSQFQIAPMIDIVFILLIFFIATYALARDEKLLDVKLPEANSGRAEERQLREVMVNLAADGQIVVNRRPYTAVELEERLRRLAELTADPGVIIRADGNCAHRHVVTVMDVCARVGITRVLFSALPVGSEEAAR